MHVHERGSEATEQGEGVEGECQPSHGRELFQFLAGPYLSDYFLLILKYKG